MMVVVKPKKQPIVEESKEGEDFPGVDDMAFRRPHVRRDPSTSTRNDGTIVN